MIKGCLKAGDRFTTLNYDKKIVCPHCEYKEKVIENNNCIYYGTDDTIFSDKDFYEAASALVGIDRNKWAFENAGYQVRLCTMPGLIASAKTDVLIGWK